MIKLYNYFRSSTSYRVRIALHLKGLAFEYIPVHLLRGGGEQHLPEFLQRNPQELVPTLEEGSTVISQSLAIMLYLEQRYPNPPLLPTDAVLRAYVHQIALMVACEMHPLCNLRVLNYLSQELSANDSSKKEWIHQWTNMGLSALETLLKNASWHGRFCVGDTPTLADCCLVPQLANARRFGIDVNVYPTLLAVEDHCLQLEAFQRAQPNCQIDAE